jgi:FlaA1/EpsC-like NDP-sugar epimerase
MRVVAVAGGTGSVGSTIVDGVVEYGKHKVYALSRKVSKSFAFNLLFGLEVDMVIGTIPTRRCELPQSGL